MGKTPAEGEDKVKKKRSFLGILMRIFLVLVLILSAVTGFVYYKRKDYTVKFLQVYGKRLAVVLTQAPNYQVPYDKDSGKTEAQVRNEKKEEVDKVFQELIAAYEKNSSDTTWYASFKNLNSHLKSIYEDSEISPLELDNFLAAVQKTAKQHSP